MLAARPGRPRIREVSITIPMKKITAGFTLYASLSVLLVSCGQTAPINTNQNPSENTNAVETPIQPTPVVTDEAPVTNANTNTSADASSLIVAYILANPEEAVGPQATIKEIELAGKSYVYVTYTGTDAEKKVLIRYAPKGEMFTLMPIASFEKGEDTTWVKTSGNNEAANEARQIYAVQGMQAVRTADIAAGKNLYTNTQLGFQMQYPRSWYFSAQNLRNEGGLQRVTFTDKAPDANPTRQIEINVYPLAAITFDASSRITLGEKQGYMMKEANGAVSYAIEGEDGNAYVSKPVLDTADQKEVIDILSSLVTK